jgi:hypothetical protein
MPPSLTLPPKQSETNDLIRLGVCPAHFQFATTLAPDADGHHPRQADGELRIVGGLRNFLAKSPVRLAVLPIFVFSGTREEDIRELLEGIKSLGLTPEVIIMITNANPMEPGDEDQFVATTVGILEIASELGIASVSSTTFEPWMDQAPEKTGEAYEAAVAQLVKGHLRIYQEAGLADSSIKSWHLEFLRPVEFSTFTNIERSWEVVRRLNQVIGRNFFRVLVDASHCGDSGMSLEKNRSVIREIAAADALGAFHASSKTTRGCLTSDEGWINALLETCLGTGKLETVIVEAFDHTDEGLQPLRDAVAGHGVDTTKGRTYDQLIYDGLDLVSSWIKEHSAASTS